MQMRPAAVATDPPNATIPTGNLVWNVTDRLVKYHAGSYSWEITVGTGVSAKVAFHGVEPTPPPRTGLQDEPEREESPPAGRTTNPEFPSPIV